MRGSSLQVVAFAAAITAIQVLTMVTESGYHLTQLTMTAYYSLLIIGLCVLVGYAGQISMGHAGFFAIGGYVSAYLTTHDFSPYAAGGPLTALATLGVLVKRPDLYGGDLLTFHPWAACVCALAATVLIAYAIGGPVLKLRGHYLAMATLGFGIIVYRLALGTSALGAADGLHNVPGFPLFGDVEVSGKSALRIWNYYIAWGVVLTGMVLLKNLTHSRVGRALSSIHGAEDAADSMGIPTARYKLNVFVLSAVFAAVGGILLTHYNAGIGPSEASVMKSVRWVAIVAVGGMANLWGALIMSLVLNYLSLRGYFGSLDDAVFGAILIAIMLFAPQGFLNRQVLRDMIRLVFRRTGERGAQ